MNEKVFKWWDWPVFILLTGLSFAAILDFLRYWFSFHDWLHYPVTFSVMTLCLIVILVNNQGRWFLLPFMRKPVAMMPRAGWKVGVVTTFVPGLESPEMLEETLTALIVLDYPHDTWVLDEGDDDRIKALCQRLGVNHFSRKNFPHYQTERGTFQSHSKHGNYNAWLYEIGFDRYEIVTTFDPDHVPDPDFLSQVLGYFEDPRVGYVQVAQVYYNQKASFISRGAAEETFDYYSTTQMASYGLGLPVAPARSPPPYNRLRRSVSRVWGYSMSYPFVTVATVAPMQVVGCHNNHRVSALKEVGGFAPHDADDLLITLFYRARGWQGVYVPQILARGLAPVDWPGYLSQQRRWARAVLDIKFRAYPQLVGNLSFGTRVMSVLHGLNYLHKHKSYVIFTGLILTASMLATGITPKVFSYLSAQKLVILYAILQLCEFYRQRFYLDPRNEWGFHWRIAVLQFAKWPYLLLALYDVLIGRRVPYVVTPKVATQSRHKLLFLPHLIVAVVICAAWTSGMLSGQTLHPLLHMCAATIVTGSLALIFTEHLNFPDAYDKTLLSSAGKGRRANPQVESG